MRVVLVALALAACGKSPLTVTGEGGRRLSTTVGREIRITLGTVGPGEYESPPEISSSSVTFEEVAVVGPTVPAGVRQEFRFRAAARGEAVIRFLHSDDDPVVEDTIDVR
jgi:hypothetical protein